jgi:hypothetical protein
VKRTDWNETEKKWDRNEEKQERTQALPRQEQRSKRAQLWRAKNSKDKKSYSSIQEKVVKMSIYEFLPTSIAVMLCEFECLDDKITAKEESF